MSFFFFNDTATTEIYTLSLHDALPISRGTFITAKEYLNLLNPDYLRYYFAAKLGNGIDDIDFNFEDFCQRVNADLRSEEHTSELQSRQYLVCRLLLEKKKKNNATLLY